MILDPAPTVSALAELIGGTFVGDPDQLVTGINEIHRVQAGDLTFCDVEKYYNKALNSAATIILINKAVEPPAGKALIVSDDPFRDYNLIAEHYQPRLPSGTGSASMKGIGTVIHPTAVLGENVMIGDRTEIGPHCYIGHNTEIGDDCIIMPNVTVYENCFIGNHVVINAGTVIGGEAFYFKKRPYGRDKMLTKGSVVIEDNVDIGANTTIDRGVSADTRIGAYTKIDNLVQIGHDTIIGKRCVIASQAGIAGASVIEDDVIIWGQVGIPSDVVIGKGAILLAKSGVISSLEGGKTYFGAPAKEYKTKWREYAALTQLPAILHQLRLAEKVKDDEE